MVQSGSSKAYCEMVKWHHASLWKRYSWFESRSRSQILFPHNFSAPPDTIVTGMNFKDQILNSGILDPEGTHHEFASGNHGRKLDFDLIDSDSSLYQKWVDVIVQDIRAHTPLPDVVFGVANGMNRMAKSVGEALSIAEITTRKLSNGTIEIPETSKKLMLGKNISFALILEDVGTTGASAYSVAQSANALGIDRVQILFTWQRVNKLTALRDSQTPHRSIIRKDMPTYSPEQCRASGYCFMGWKLIRR